MASCTAGFTPTEARPDWMIPAYMETSLIEIDGAGKSGSGTLVRTAVALCSLTGRPMRMYNIREKREKPGLRPQHLMAVKACAQLCSGHLEGAETGSREIVYYPGKKICGGAFEWDIGTAGSATMMASTVIPLALFSGMRSLLTIRGGLFQDFAPTALYMAKVLLPLLGRMGAKVGLEMVRPGYIPKGNGELVVSVESAGMSLEPFQRTRRGKILKLRGISLASHLEREAVCGRMADRGRELLAREGWSAEIEIINDSTAVQKGAALLMWAESEGDCLLGFDMAGKLGRSSEVIAQKVVSGLLADIATGATVDRFAADQLILFAGLAAGQSRYIAPGLTDHMESNFWLIEKILGARIGFKENLICIDGIGFFGK